MGVSASVYAETLEEIEVRADRLNSRLSASAYSVSAIQQDDSQRLDIQHPSELLRHANIWVSQGSGQEHLTAIRSPVFTGAGACGNFLISEDGIPVRSHGFCNVNQLFDTFYETSQQVEVYRGPLSAARGGNALFGGIDFYTPDKDQQWLNISSASHDAYQASWNTAVGHWQSYGSVNHSDSFRDTASVKQQKLGVKYAATVAGWQVDNNVQLNNLEQETAGFIEGFEAYKHTALARQNPNPEAYRDVQSLRFYSRWQKDGISITPYLRSHDMAFLMHFVPWQPRETNSHNTLGFQAQYEQQWSASLSSIHGMEAEHTQASLKEEQFQAAPFGQDRFPEGVHYDYRVGANYWGVFSHWVWQPTTPWQANVQLRADSTHYDYQNRTAAGYACDEGVEACRFYRPADTLHRFENITGRLALRYAMTDSHYVYGTIGNAYRAPQATELYRLQSDTQASLDSPNVVGWELGLKGSSSHWRYQLAYYQQRQFDGIYQNSERVYLTGATTAHKGLEYAVEWAILPQLSLRANGQFARHRYSNNPEQLGVSTDIQGNDIDTAPRQQHTAVLQWQPLAKSRVDVQYHRLASYFVEPTNSHRYQGHSLWNVRFAQDTSTRTTVSLQFKNILNERYAQRADFAFGEYRYFPSDGRSVVLTVMLKRRK